MENQEEEWRWWKRVALKGQQLVMLPYLPAHVPKYHDWMQNPQLLELTGSEPLSLDEEYEMQQSWASDPNKCTFIILDLQRIRDKFSPPAPHVDAMIGDVNLYMNDIEDSSVAEIEIMIAESESRGRGLGKEAVKLMMAFAFHYLGIQTFKAKIGESNLVSINLFKSLGFKDVTYSSVFKQVTMEVTPSVLSKDYEIIQGF